MPNINELKLAKELIKFPSVTPVDAGAIGFLAKQLRRLGFDCKILEFKDKNKISKPIKNIYARLGNKSPNLCYAGHTDVVPVSKGWSTDPFVAEIKDDKLYGRGSCDMKGFLACSLAFADIFSKSNLSRDIHFSLTFDEETACVGAPLLIKELKKRKITNGICIVGEPTKMKIIDSHKACYEYTTFFEGLAGHSSKPDEGVNAAEYASRYVNKLMSLRNDLKNREPDNSIFTPPYSTLSIGGIFGGIAHNVIADKCHVNWETRPVNKQDGIFLNNEIDNYANELLTEMKKKYPNASIRKKIIGEIIGFDRIQDSKACEFVSSITGDNKREVVSFGTEAGLFQEIGISTVVCGPGSIEQAHTIDEFIELNEIKKCLSFLEGVKERSVIN